MNDDIVIRPAEPHDAESIADLASKAFQEYRSLLPAYFQNVNRQYWYDRFAKSLTLKNFFVFAGVIRRPDKKTSLVGYIDLYLKFTTSELVGPRKRMIIDNLVVDPAFRNRGIATSLLQFSEQFAANCGADIIELETAIGNDAAHNLYQKAGYVSRSVTLEKKTGRP